MISIKEAQDKILENIAMLDAVEQPLPRGLGKVLAENVDAPWDIPTVDNSAMDGYAFAADSLPCASLKVVGFIAAGEQRSTPVGKGEAVKIMTGAPVPAGCDTVVPIEKIEMDGDRLCLLNEVKRGSHVRYRGEAVAGGTKVFTAGTLLRSQEIGMLATLGKATVKVHRPPTVAVIATGDELVEIDTVPSKASITNSNSYSLEAQLSEAGAVPKLLGIAKDEKESIRALVLKGLQDDAIILSGGVSVGDKDFVKDVISELGGEIKFWKINIKPGKPVAFALLEGTPIFCLPGNPVSTMVAFERFVRPALLKMMGHACTDRPLLKATLTADYMNKGKRPQVVLVNMSLEEGRYYANPVEQSSYNLLALMAANGLFEIPASTALPSGTEIDVMQLNPVQAKGPGQ